MYKLWSILGNPLGVGEGSNKYINTCLETKNIISITYLIYIYICIIKINGLGFLHPLSNYNCVKGIEWKLVLGDYDRNTYLQL